MQWNEILRQLRAAGVKVVEIDGWQRRSRPGRFSPKGVLAHHTGGTPDGLEYAEWMALTGRDDLPAPLAQLGLDRKGVVYMQAAGRANHAGRCKAVGRWLAAGDGNAQLVGIEAMNTGSEGWGARQYSAYVTLCAVICRVQDWPASHVLAHRETSLTGKWDPGLLDMGRFRRDIDRAIDQEDDMPYTSEQLIEYSAAGSRRAIKESPDYRSELKAVISEVVEARLNDSRGDYDTGYPISVANIGSHLYAHRAWVKGRQNDAKLDAILDAVANIPGVDGDALAATVAAAVERIDAEAIVEEMGEQLRGEV